MAQPGTSGASQGNEDWKSKLALPPKDTRIRTEVRGPEDRGAAHPQRVVHGQPGRPNVTVFERCNRWMANGQHRLKRQPPGQTDSEQSQALVSTSLPTWTLSSVGA